MATKQNKRKSYPLVNWTDGLLVRKNHLMQLEDHFINQLCEYQSYHLNRTNYGFLPFRKGEPVSGDFSITELVTGTLEVRLKRCHAVTAGGYLIDYDADENEGLTASFHISVEDSDDREQKWDVILMADPFERQPSGTPDETESVPRQPDALPKYRLNVLPAGQVDGGELGRYYLVIGRLRRNGNRCEVDGNFIPPCSSMSSHPDLKGYYAKFGQLIDSIEKASIDILAKVENAEKQTELAANIGMLCRHVMLYISDIYFSFRNEGQYYSPIRFLNVFSTLAHRLYICLGFMGKEEKEDLLKYFYEWNGVKPGAYEGVLRENCGMRYDHHDIRLLMVTTERFLYLFNDLWTTLSRLEYIGKHKENIVVAERSRQSKETTETRWNILD